MALKTCRECGQSVSSSARVCPHCGTRSPTSSPTTALIIAVVVTVFILLTATMGGSGASRSGSSKSGKCYYCGGSGWVSNGSMPKDAIDFASNHKTCPKCHGTGKAR